jgi:hypothetical protein
MTALILAWGIYSVCWGERVPRHEGFGWDGVVYRSMTEHLWEPNPLVSFYNGRRILPSAAVHYTLKAFRMSLSRPHILRTFATYNMLLMVACLWMLLDSCTAVGIGKAGRWALFVGVFCNYVHMKQHYYSACVTDMWAFACAVAAVWCYPRRRGWGVLLASVVGAFTWPVLMHFGAVLFLLPRPADPGLELSSAPNKERRRWLATVLAGLAALALVEGTAWVVWKKQFFGTWPLGVSVKLLPLSIPCAAVFLFLALRPLLAGPALTRWRQYVSLATVGRVVALALAVLLVQAAYKQIDPLCLDSDLPLEGGMVKFLRCVVSTSAGKPFIFGVSHVIWYGPIVLAMAYCWGAVCRRAHALGAGLVVSALLGVFMALNPESRQSMTFFPIFALLTAAAIDRLGWGRWRWVVFVGLALALSKAWLPLNRVPWPADNEVENFPMQLFFMSFGGYMMPVGYYIQGAAVLVAGGAMAWVVARSGGALAGGDEEDLARPGPPGGGHADRLLRPGEGDPLLHPSPGHRRPHRGRAGQRAGGGPGPARTRREGVRGGSGLRVLPGVGAWLRERLPDGRRHGRGAVGVVAPGRGRGGRRRTGRGGDGILPDAGAGAGAVEPVGGPPPQ